MTYLDDLIALGHKVTLSRYDLDLLDGTTGFVHYAHCVTCQWSVESDHCNDTESGNRAARYVAARRDTHVKNEWKKAISR